MSRCLILVPPARRSSIPTCESLTSMALTGSPAVQDPDGFVYIHDRIKDMIISGGENVYPAEIEDVLLSHPGISDVAVVAMPSARWGESPLAVVVRADPELDEAAVLDHCSGKLARYKLPRRVVFIDI